MQSKITSFTLPNDESAVLYGNYDNLRPVTVHGVAHAFPNASEVLITLYSLTGMKEGSEYICSADLRLSLDKNSLAGLLNQLQMIQESFFPPNTQGTEEVEKINPQELSSSKIDHNEKLSAPL